MEWLRDVILIGFGNTHHTCFKHCIPHLIKLHWNHIIKNNFLPCSTTLVENSSLRVNWEQFVTDCEERASILGVWSEVDSAPPSPSIPTTGRKPAISPKSMDTHAERRSILSCEVVLTISLTEPTGWLRVSRCWNRAFQVHSSTNESIMQVTWAARLISFCVFSPWWRSRVAVQQHCPSRNKDAMLITGRSGQLSRAVDVWEESWSSETESAAGFLLQSLVFLCKTRRREKNKSSRSDKRLSHLNKITTQKN